jgi:glycosyltransferase involved in cell wall biosynthesis
MRVELVTRAGSELARRAAAHGVTVHGVSWRWGFDPRTVLGLLPRLAPEPPDIIHVHDAHALSVVRWALRLRRLPAPRRPAVVATRRVDFHLRRAASWIATDAIIAISAAVKRILVSDGVPESHIRVVPDGIDPGEIRWASTAAPNIRSRLGLPAGVPLAVNVAALVGHKDQLTLIEAAAHARDEGANLVWVIAGEGPKRPALERAIKDLGLASHVHLVGYIEEVDALINEADVLVMSSREEGLGSVVLHALALGKPVVATRAGGLPELVGPRWLADVGDARGLAARVVTAITQRPRTVLPERHTVDAMAAAVVATYEALV